LTVSLDEYRVALERFAHNPCRDPGWPGEPLLDPIEMDIRKRIASFIEVLTEGQLDAALGRKRRGKKAKGKRAACSSGGGRG